MTSDGESCNVTPRGILPDDEILAAGLGAVAIVRRDLVSDRCSGDCEVVVCRMPDDSCRQLFCKYGQVPASGSDDSFSVGYETQVYDQLLGPWRNDVTPFHGVFRDETTQTICLALTCVPNAIALEQLSDPKAGLLTAARWIGCFHRWGETATVPKFLRRYDTQFYRHWIERAAESCRNLRERFPRLPDACQFCLRRLPALLPPATIIHGAYEARNILVLDDRNAPTNWEATALAAGEIDLANLTWGWESDLVLSCEQQYCLARWTDGQPDDFALRLAAARAYLQFRRLGDAEDVDEPEQRVLELEELLPLVEGLRDPGQGMPSRNSRNLS
jgi:hypothetical protein